MRVLIAEDELRLAFAFACGLRREGMAVDLAPDKFAECMRAHHIDIPDPTTSAGGGFGIFRQIPSSQRNSPAFRSALQACSSTLPFRRGGGGGGGVGGGAANPGA